MSRTFRRKNKQWMERLALEGNFDFSFHSGTLYYDMWLREEGNPLPYLMYLSVKYRCDIEKISRRSKARFHSDAEKPQWYLRSNFVRGIERNYRHLANYLVDNAGRAMDPEDYDYGLSQKYRKVHIQFFS